MRPQSEKKPERGVEKLPSDSAGEMGKAQPRTIAKRRYIIEVAAELFTERGFEKTSIKAVAEAAQVSTSTIYSYFENKSDLFDQTMYTIIDEVLQKAQEEAARHSDPFESVAAVMRLVNGSLSSNLLLRRIYTFQRHSTGHRIRVYADQFADRMDDLCREALVGVFVDGPSQCDDPVALNAVMRFAIQGWLMSASFGKPTVSEERLTEAFLSLLQAAAQGKAS